MRKLIQYQVITHKTV